VYALCSFAFIFAGRWLSQRFGGARQQGVFSIGQQFSTISLLATTSMTQVFRKEIAAATVSDRDRAAKLYRSTSRGLGAVGLTIKMIAVNVTSVNLQAYAIARRLGTTYDWRHQVLTLGCLLALAFGCRFAAQELFGVSSSAPGLAAAIVGAAAYTAASAVLLVP
jgi:hypothetical protein